MEGKLKSTRIIETRMYSEGRCLAVKGVAIKLNQYVSYETSGNATYNSAMVVG